MDVQDAVGGNALCSPSPVSFEARPRLCFLLGQSPAEHGGLAVRFVGEMPVKLVLGGGNGPPGVYVLPAFSVYVPCRRAFSRAN